MVKDLVADNGSSYPSEFVDVNGTLYFEAQDTVSGTNSIWKSDGTASGTVVVANGTNGGYKRVRCARALAATHRPQRRVRDRRDGGDRSALSLFSDNGSGADTVRRSRSPPSTATAVRSATRSCSPRARC
ncbi:MAG: hypothetical protein WDN08_18125 [Rhizomicrobium sp.]